MLALFGGSFDPVHVGHLTNAELLLDSLAFDALRFIPCGNHALDKAFSVDQEHRIAMLEAGIAGLKNQGKIDIDLREIKSSGVSYSVDTCSAIRAECGRDRSISLIVGHDVLGQLHRWRRWRELFDFVNLIIVYRGADHHDERFDADTDSRFSDSKPLDPRPLDSEQMLLQQLLSEERADPEVKAFLLGRHVDFDSRFLQDCSHGRVMCRRLCDITVSSSEIRAALNDFWAKFSLDASSCINDGSGISCSELSWPNVLQNGLSDSVKNYIFDNKLYR